MDNLFDLPPLPDPAGQTDKERGYAMRQYTASQMQAYARAAVEAEREACAKRCDERALAWSGLNYTRETEAQRIAEEIRARGKS